MPEVSAVSEVIETLKLKVCKGLESVWQKSFAPLRHWQVGKQVMPCSKFSGHETWCARVHGKASLFASFRDEQFQILKVQSFRET